MTDGDRENLTFVLSDGSTPNTTVDEVTIDRIDEFSERYDFGTRSAAVRELIRMGLNSVLMNDPRTHPSTDGEQNEGSDSVKLKQFVPVGKENAIEVRPELVERIENGLLEAVQDDPDIEMDGWEVYRNEG
jgi:hypothetical protein